MGLYRTIVDAIVADLQTHVPELANATAHRYQGREPEFFERDGQRHFAVWPENERPEVAIPLTTLPGAGGGADELTASIVMTYWEPYESKELGQQQEAAAGAFLDLAENTRARLYSMANQSIAGSWKLRYDRMHLDADNGLRWFALSFTVSVNAVYTA